MRFEHRYRFLANNVFNGCNAIFRSHNVTDATLWPQTSQHGGCWWFVVHLAPKRLDPSPKNFRIVLDFLISNLALSSVSYSARPIRYVVTCTKAVHTVFDILHRVVPCHLGHCLRHEIRATLSYQGASGCHRPAFQPRLAAQMFTRSNTLMCTGSIRGLWERWCHNPV